MPAFLAPLLMSAAPSLLGGLMGGGGGGSAAASAQPSNQNTGPITIQTSCDPEPTPTPTYPNYPPYPSYPYYNYGGFYPQPSYPMPYPITPSYFPVFSYPRVYSCPQTPVTIESGKLSLQEIYLLKLYNYRIGVLLSSAVGPGINANASDLLKNCIQSISLIKHSTSLLRQKPYTQESIWEV